MLSYNLLSELPLRHKSHNNSLSELLLTITLTNTSSITRTKQTKYIENKTITVIKAFKKVSEAVVTLETVTVSRKVKATVNIIY